MKAVTIRVNDVDGVAGFVLPGDRVDVLMTRQLEKTSAMNDVVLQNARVLAIDQVADDRTDKPSVAKAVTLEVDIIGAQRLSLASQVGSLSLALRKAGETDPMNTRLVTLADLLNTKQADDTRSRYAFDRSRCCGRRRRQFTACPRMGSPGALLSPIERLASGSSDGR